MKKENNEIPAKITLCVFLALSLFSVSHSLVLTFLSFFFVVCLLFFLSFLQSIMGSLRTVSTTPNCQSNTQQIHMNNVFFTSLNPDLIYSYFLFLFWCLQVVLNIILCIAFREFFFKKKTKKLFDFNIYKYFCVLFIVQTHMFIFILSQTLLCVIASRPGIQIYIYI